MTVTEAPIKAIPTVYGGVTFRSRLEARWAAFFDLANVVWDYEPSAMDGWAPDFAITLDGATVYAEVKPVELQKMDYPIGIHLPHSDLFGKAKRHCRNVWVLCLGNGPQSDSDYFGIGTLFDPPDSENDDGPGWFEINSQLGFANERALWRQAGNMVQWRKPL